MHSHVRGFNSILVLGASVRAAAASIKRAGLKPLAADLFCDADLRAMCECEAVRSYPDDAQRHIADTKADAWMYTGGFENHASLVDKLARNLPLLGNTGDILCGVRNPWRVATLLRENGISVPTTLPPGQVPKAGAWISKPLRSCGGKGVFDWGEHHARLAIGVAGTHQNASVRIFQKRINGQAVGALYVADTMRSQLCGVTEQLVGLKWLGAKQFTYAGSIGPMELPARAQQQLQVIGAALTSEFRLKGIFGVDAIWDGTDVWPIEVNPRYTASVEVLERALGISVVRAHVEACQSSLQRLALPDTPRQRSGKAVVYAQENVVITPELLEFIDTANSQSELPSIVDIPHLADQVEMGRPLVSLLADAPDSRQVVSRLQCLARSIGLVLYGRELTKPDA